MPDDHELDQLIREAFRATDAEALGWTHRHRYVAWALDRIAQLVECGDVGLARDLVREAVVVAPNSPDLAGWARVLAPPVVQTGSRATGRDRAREARWLRENAARYPGEWIALAGETLLANGTHYGRVRREAASKVNLEVVLFHFEAALPCP